MTHVVAQAFGWCLLAWIGALALAIAFRILRGDIALYGLLSAGGQRFDPERVQSFAVFIFVIGGYLLHALYTPGQHNTLPDIPESLLVLLAGSNGVFLAGKIARTEIAKTRSETNLADRPPGGG